MLDGRQGEQAQAKAGHGIREQKIAKATGWLCVGVERPVQSLSSPYIHPLSNVKKWETYVATKARNWLKYLMMFKSQAEEFTRANRKLHVCVFDIACLYWQQSKVI